MGKRKPKVQVEAKPQPKMSDARLDGFRLLCAGDFVSDKPLRECIAEIDRLRAEISRYDTPLGKESIGPHRQPKDCPSWYDHCHCTVQNFFEKAKDNDRLRAEVAAKDAALSAADKLAAACANSLKPPERIQIDMPELVLDYKRARKATS